MVASPSPEMSIELLTMTQATVLIGELRIAGPVGISHHAAQVLPLRFRSDRDRDPFVIAGAWVGVMWRHHIVTVAALSAVAAVHEVVQVPFRHLADDCLAHARVDPLALARAIAMPQRSEDMKRDGTGDRIVWPSPAGLARRAARIPLRVEHANEATRHRTPADPPRGFEAGFSQQRHRDHYDIRLDRANAVIGDPEFVRRK